MKITEDESKELDDLIFENDKMAYLKKLRGITGVTLGEAIKNMTERYKYLRSTNPSGFKQTDEEYWDGFYS